MHWIYILLSYLLWVIFLDSKVLWTVHMPDLGEEFDLVSSQVKWITAWSVTNKHITSKSFPYLKTIAEQ